MPVVPIFMLSPTLSLTVEQFYRLIATENPKTAPHLFTLRLQSRYLNAGPGCTDCGAKVGSAPRSSDPVRWVLRDTIWQKKGDWQDESDSIRSVW